MIGTQRTSQERLFDIVREKVEILDGSRGASGSRAVRVGELSGLNTALASVTRKAGSALATQRSLTETLTAVGHLVDATATKVADAGSVTAPSPTAANIAAAPTAADYNALVADVAALRAALRAIVEHLT